MRRVGIFRHGKPVERTVLTQPAPSGVQTRHPSDCRLQHGPVLAANDGKVIWAEPLGIYGNCIVLDHGYGLQSIYGHLSQITVKEGAMVTRGQEMGRSGSTGLAGGDHLHFSMQVDGVQVNPIEWWDEHWITDHVRSRVKMP